MSNVTGKEVFEAIGDLLDKAGQVDSGDSIFKNGVDSSRKLRVEKPLEKFQAALANSLIELPSEYQRVLTDYSTVRDREVLVVEARSRPETVGRYPAEAKLSISGFTSGRGLEVKVKSQGENFIAITSLAEAFADSVYALCAKLMAGQPQPEQAAQGLEIVALAKIALGFGR